MLFEHYHSMIKETEFDKYNDPDNIWAVERAYHDCNCEIISDKDYRISAKAHDVGDCVIERYNGSVYVDVYVPCDYAVHYSNIPESELSALVGASAGESVRDAYANSEDFKEFLSNADL